MKNGFRKNLSENFNYIRLNLKEPKFDNNGKKMVPNCEEQKNYDENNLIIYTRKFNVVATDSFKTGETAPERGE